MGIDEYADRGTGIESSTDGEQVRPYVSEQTHDMVRDFTSRAGLNISEGYDLLIQGILNHSESLESVIESELYKEGELNDLEKDLLLDIAKKWDDCGHFPTRDEINNDSSMKGFPVYVINLGTRDMMKMKVVEDLEHHPTE